MKTNRLGIIFKTALCISSFVGVAPTYAVDLNQRIFELAEDLTTTKNGEVLDGNDKEVYIALGERDGIIPGNQFEIIRQGDPLKAGDEIIGYKETKVAVTEIMFARERVSGANVISKIQTPAAGDKAYQIRKQIKQLVVSQFSFNQLFNRFTKSLQEKLFTAMTNKGLQVVERDQLEKVLKEQKLGYSGLINLDSAKKIGELLGAEAMMLGTVSDLGDNIAINARLVDLETGNSITAAETTMPKTPLIVQLLDMPVEDKPFVENPSPQPGSGSQSGEFFDDFKQGPHPDWESVSGDWTMANGKFTVATIREKQPYSVYLRGHKWNDIKLHVKANARQGRSDYLYADICPRSMGPRDKVCFVLGGKYGFQNVAWRVTKKGNSGDDIGKKEIEATHDKTIEVVIEIRGGVYSAYIDGQLVSEYYNNRYDEGSIVLGQWYKNTKNILPIEFDDVKVIPLK